jgi:hypothetical protein
MALACAAQWFGGSDWVGAAGTREFGDQLCLAASPKAEEPEKE